MDVETLARSPDWEWPEDAGQVLAAALRNRGGDDSVRLLAAGLSGSIVAMSDDLARALLDVVGSPDEDPELRGAAAIALGPILEDLDLGMYHDGLEPAPVSPETERAIRSGLREAYRGTEAPKLVRRRALEASVRAPEDWHAAAVRAAYHGDDGEWRVTAVFCMGHLPGFGDEILEALESGDPRLRYEAVRAAGLRGLEGAWPRIRRLLRPETERSLLLVAIEAAPLVRPEEAVDLLLPLAEADDEEIAGAASEALEWVDLYWVRETTGGVLQIEDGALYTALHRMEERGWLSSEWGISDRGRRAKFYQLTAEGRRRLEAEERDWRRYVEAVGKVFAADRGHA